MKTADVCIMTLMGFSCYKTDHIVTAIRGTATSCQFCNGHLGPVSWSFQVPKLAYSNTVLEWGKVRQKTLNHKITRFAAPLESHLNLC